jgi:hypothetical protein
LSATELVRRPVIPVLVQHATMPKAQSLPGSLRELAYRHETGVRPDPHFLRDMDQLIQQITPLMSATLPQPVPAPQPAPTLTLPPRARHALPHS